MISGLFSIVTAVWFFITAREIGKNAWVWAALGFICFQGSFTILTKLIVLPLSIFSQTMHDSTFVNSFIWVVVTAMSTFIVMFVRNNHLKGQTVAKDSMQ